jgi:hypothetical protein
MAADFSDWLSWPLPHGFSVVRERSPCPGFKEPTAHLARPVGAARVEIIIGLVQDRLGSGLFESMLADPVWCRHLGRSRPGCGNLRIGTWSENPGVGCDGLTREALLGGPNI